MECEGEQIVAVKIHYPRMPKETQKTVAWLVKSYPRLVLQRHAILEASPRAPEVPGKSNKIMDPTGQTAAKLEKVTDKLHAIEAAKEMLPFEYRQGVWNNCVLGTRFPDYADPKTWKLYKNDFLFLVAAELGMPLERD